MAENKISFIGDSAEYEVISYAVELTKNVDGMLCEIGLRLGMGTSLMIEGVRGTKRRVISIDPYGHIEYEHKEGQIVRLDYTNQMRNECLSRLYAFIGEVNYKFFNDTDLEFFDKYSGGVWWYELDHILETKYSCVHLDGPHAVEPITKEIMWFNDRMDRGACIIIDDVSEEYIDFDKIRHILWGLHWEELKTGNKKSLWRKL